MRSCWSSTCTWVRGTTVVVPLDNGAGWLTSRRLGDPDGQVALRDRHGADPHVGAHHDGAAGLLDHHDGGAVGLDAQVLERGERLDRIAVGEVERHGARIGRLGDRANAPG